MQKPCKTYIFSEFYASNYPWWMYVCHFGMALETAAFAAHDLYTLRVSFNILLRSMLGIHECEY